MDPENFDLNAFLSNADEPESLTTRVPRQRMKQWLEEQVNSGFYPGLEWINKQERTFKIPWVHFGKPADNDVKNAMLFRAWAVHTDKYNKDKPNNVSRWKTNFRCALDRQPEILKLPELFKSDPDESFRAYKFIGSQERNQIGGKLVKSRQLQELKVVSVVYI